MRSKTLFFNKTLFCKTVTRFWPLWLIYFGVLFVAGPMSLNATMRWSPDSPSVQRLLLSNAVEAGLVFGCIAAVLAVMAVWSFLYSARSVSGIASLPLRREGVFVSVSLAGLLPLLAVHVLIALMELAVMAFRGHVDAATVGVACLAQSLLLLHFYGSALLCAQLTGNVLVLPAVYTVLNFTSYVVEALLRSICSAFVYGLMDQEFYTAFLSPPIYLYSRVTVAREQTYSVVHESYETVGYHLEGLGIAALYALVGLVLAAAALWLYRRRRMETAGDVVAIDVLKPVFKYCMTFGCAIVLGVLLYSFMGGVDDGSMSTMLTLLLFMLLGAFIGYFAAEMLIHKSFRVWRGKWAGIGVSMALIVAFMFAMELDVFGVERRVPDEERVESVTLIYSGDSTMFTTPENIAAVTALHESIIANKDWHENHPGNGRGYAEQTVAVEAYDAKYAPTASNTPQRQYLRISYLLNNGRTLERAYYLYYILGVPETYGDTATLQTLVNTSEAIEQRKATAFEILAENIITGSVTTRVLSTEAAGLSGYVNGDDDFYHVQTGEYVGRYDPERMSDGLYQSSYRWEFTKEEWEELYYTCILPDIADGTLGRLWLIADEDYRATVYDTNIGIDARILRPDVDNGHAGYYDPYLYEYFNTVPTVDSHRTNAWLREHGIPLHTFAELDRVK